MAPVQVKPGGDHISAKIDIGQAIPQLIILLQDDLEGAIRHTSAKVLGKLADQREVPSISQSGNAHSHLKLSCIIKSDVSSRSLSKGCQTEIPTPVLPSMMDNSRSNVSSTIPQQDMADFHSKLLCAMLPGRLMWLPPSHPTILLLW